MQFVKSNFAGGKVQLDGNEFIRCRFENTTLVFSAKGPVSMVDCTFANNVAWTFEGPAALTLAFLNALYHGAGDGGKQLVESTFANIRHAPAKFVESVSTISQQVSSS
jgi:hypothetical protein